MTKNPTKSDQKEDPAVSVSGSTALTAPAASAVAEAGAFDDYSGPTGLENVTANDLLVPRLGILQALSPQLSRKKVEYIDGGEVGDICDLGMGEVFKEPVLFLPVYYQKDYLEWFPRASGKGLAAIHSSPDILDQCERTDKGKMVLPNGNLIVETAQFYGFNLTVGGRRSFIAMSGTQLKKAKKWLTLSTGERIKRGDGSTFVPPMFFRSYILTTGTESNNEGEWAGWVIERGKSLPELSVEIDRPWRALKEDAERFVKQLMAGEAKADKSTLGGDEGGSPSSEAAM